MVLSCAQFLWISVSVSGSFFSTRPEPAGRFEDDACRVQAFSSCADAAGCRRRRAPPRVPSACPAVLLSATKLIRKPKVRVVHVETLIAAVKGAADAFLHEAQTDPAKWALILQRSEKLFDENPELDFRVNRLFTDLVQGK